MTLVSDVAFLSKPGVLLVPKKKRTKSGHICSCSAGPDLAASSISEIYFRNRRVFVKRDDELCQNGVSGNKVRKFASLNVNGALSNVDGIVSFGGAQSNAMLALANLSAHHSVPFAYITRPIPQRIESISGNFRTALSTGMKHIQISVEGFKETFMEGAPMLAADAARTLVIDVLNLDKGANLLFVPQGAAWPGAEVGVKQLAAELRADISKLRSDGVLNLRRPIVFLSAGTGATAFFLAQHLSDIAKIVTVPASGNEKYLLQQMRWLQSACAASPIFPDILCPRIRSSFADVRADKFRIWQEMQRAAKGAFGFDLVYAPKTWEEVFLAIDENRLNTHGEDLFYYHSGGLEGNASMIDRFEKKGYVV